jgi:hypothetical protein
MVLMRLQVSTTTVPITDEEAPRHGRQLHQFSIFMQKGCNDAIHIIRFFAFFFLGASEADIFTASSRRTIP